ncbi:hypothetical protein KFK09_005655 [Dendrobium nobile]|uniref:Uncharacterized protein n=1 Tax=Dendrobium nobile TaxID=94219 RepID=A0A8T3BYZ0_DENNO|nr:hypothetical protein KFK09_005655 [Dendrobium nobile]
MKLARTCSVLLIQVILVEKACLHHRVEKMRVCSFRESVVIKMWPYQSLKTYLHSQIISKERKKRKKEKKDKGSRKKHGDKDGGDKHRFEDPEYLEQKRLKKERKQMVKMVARMQEDESRTSASESLDNRKLCKSRDLNNLEESDVHAPNPTKSASDSLQISKEPKLRSGLEIKV